MRPAGESDRMKTDQKLEAVVRNVLGAFRIHPKDGTVRTLAQFVKFGVVGLSSTVFNYAVNVGVLLLLRPYGLSWDYIAGNVVAFVLSVLWSFYWNNKYVFSVGSGEQRDTWRTLIKTYMAYGFTGIILNNVLSAIWINALGISKYVAPMLNLIFSIPLNFIINKVWAFRTKK